MSNREHDIRGGIDISGGYLETFNLILYSVLAWFTITLEAFLRWDFGERYYTRTNFFVGFWLLTFLTFFSSLLGGIMGNKNIGAGSWFIWLAYIILSAFHFWKIWVNSQIGRPCHSKYDGQPHFLRLGRWSLKWVNPLCALIARALGSFSLKKENNKLLNNSLEISPIFIDAEKFTKMYVEPFVLILILFFVPGLPSLWLSVAIVAHIIFTRMGYVNARHDELDVADGIINAAFAKEDLEGQRRLKQQMRAALILVQERIQTEPEYIEEIKEENPNILEALQSLDIDLSGSSTGATNES